MASTGFKFAGTGASLNTGEQAWGTPENVTADDNAYAQTPDDFGVSSDRLLASNYDFSSIPDGSTIDGIEYRYHRKVASTGVAIASTSVILYHDGSAIGVAKTAAGDWEGTETVVTIGGAADVWSATLTAAIVKSSTFGGALSVLWDAGGFPAGGTADVDCVEMNVHYTAPVGGASDLLLRHVG